MSLENQLLAFVASNAPLESYGFLCRWRPHYLPPSRENSTKLLYSAAERKKANAKEEVQRAPLVGICAIANAILCWLAQEREATLLLATESRTEFNRKEMVPLSLECTERVE